MRTIDFLDKRVTGICNELKKLSVKQKFETSDWLIKPGNFLRPEDADADPAPFEPFDSRTMHWYGPDKHYWFRADVAVPQEMDGKPLWMHVCTQIDEWDDAKNPQFLLFVDGKVTQGVDMNHRDILLDRCAKGGQKYRLELQSYTGILHTEFNLIVDLREIDPEIEGLYYDMVVPLEAFPRLEEDGKARRDLENVLNEAVNLIDLRTPYNESFYQSIAAARRYLAKALYTDLAGHEEVIASCIGHTHIDVAWWWTVAQTREKVCRSFATVLKLMDEYPNYKFMSSQPQLYYFLKQRYPELYEQIKQRVTEGRWEPEGGMWVEADCNLTSGESLVRQFLYGKRFFKEEFGVDNRILWLPDVFGYSGALPQIMAKCGIDYFMTTKLAWNQFNKMPYDTFKWRGIDGTEILTHLVTTLGVGQSENDFFTTYNGILHPDALIGGWHRYQQKDINNDILISYGYGDGGGGPTRAMLETSTRMEKGIEGLPKVRQAFARTYFDELAERVKDNRRLPTWEGELYFEYHRGTYTSMARNKRSNRKIELHMMDLELLSLLAQAKVAYPEAEIDKLWHGILINQFHDILPGSSIHEVYEVTKKEYAEMEAEITALREERLDALTPAGEGVTVYNTTGFVRSDVVELGDCKAEALQDEAGNIYPVQKTADGAVAFLNNLPAKIALNSEWRFYNFLYCLNSSATEPMSPECNELDYERLKHTALIAKSMDNSTTNKKVAIRLASIDFSQPATITLQPSQIQKALACLEECEYRTNGYVYLLFKSQKLEARITQQLQRSPEVCDAVLEKYISALKNEDYRSIDTYRAFLSGIICDFSAIEKANSTVRYFANADISIRLYVELLCLCCMVDSGDCHDYLCHALQEIRKNQNHRHALIDFLSRNPTYYKVFTNVQVKNYTNELEILSGLYEGSIYANDAYYLGIMEHKEYKKFCGSDSTDYLCDLALFDFEEDTDEGDEKISRFFEYATPKIRKKVKKTMKAQLTISINQKLKEAWQLLRSAIKEKYQTASRLKELL